MFNRAGEILQSALKGVVMLERKNGSRNEYGNLLVVANRLECSPDCNFGFSESYVSAYQPIHRTVVFHILLYCPGCSLLIRRIFKHK